MKKSLVTASIVAVVGLGSTLFGEVTYADPVSELKDQQSEIKDERSKIKKDLSEAEAKIADVLIDLEELNEEIEKLNGALEKNEQAMKKTEGNIAELEAEIQTLEDEIEALEEKIAWRADILKERMASYQKSGGNINFLDVIFGSKSFNDLISRISAVVKITNSDQELLEEQEQDKVQVEEHLDDVEVKLKEQEDLKVELEGMEILILDQKEQNEKNKKKLKDKEKELNNLVDELESEDRTLAELEARVKSEINAAQSPETVTARAEGQGGNEVATTANSPSKKNNNNNQPKQNAPAGASGGANAAISAGYQQLGVPYVTAGKGPGGFDCSGFVSWAYGQAGYSIPSSTEGLRTLGQRVSYSQAQPGDLIFFDTYKRDGHVAIYLGNGQFLGAQNSTGVAVASVSNSYWSNAFKGHVRRLN